MTPLRILLGKTGDLLALLPALRLISIDQGSHARLMVSKEYAGLLDGVSYVEPVIWDGDWMDLKGAVAKARELSPTVTVCQVAGRPNDIRELAFTPACGGGKPCAMTDSFVKDSWRLAGRWADWRKVPPMVFDRRNTAREEALVSATLSPRKKNDRRKLILVSTGGASSPFRYGELLRYLVGREFDNASKWEIVDLATVKAERVFDLLALYEKAAVLISTDSAPLHLAAAVPTLPVIALIQDHPEAWVGSPWRPGHIFHCRYSDFPERAVEMLKAVESVALPGNWFFRGVEGNRRRTIHVWSGYEEEGRGAVEARHDWYSKNWQWTRTPVTPGAVGRDSRLAIGDTGRFPFLKDVVALATMRARMDDTICLTRADTCVAADVEFGWSHRVTRSADGDVWSPYVDMVAFPRSWWEKNAKDVPDLFLDSGWQWARVLRELIRETGGVEVEGACWRAAA